MRKITKDIDNPIDNYLIDLADKISPFFYKTGHTPNMITTYSLITGLIACHFLWKGHVLWFAIFYAISYFFDCMDGHFARKYEMTSKFGDMYDHIKDVLVVVLIIIIIYKRCRKNISIPVIIVFAVSTLLAGAHLGCQQRYCTEDDEDPEDSKFLNKARVLCPNKEYIKWTRFFGTGTYNLILILIISYICYSSSKGCKW